MQINTDGPRLPPLGNRVGGGLALPTTISRAIEAAMNMTRTLIRSDFGIGSERESKQMSGRTQPDGTGWYDHRATKNFN